MSDENNIEKIDLNKVDWRGSREFFESLGEALDKLDDKDESYDFTWVGKRKAIVEAGSPINKTLRPDVENSKKWETTENLFIEGDNLDALKLLQESYLGKVKMIYIDPPYNTGNNLVYKNDFSINKENYEAITGSVNDYGDNLIANFDTSGRFHSDWCSMFYSRVRICRNLLTRDGFFVCAMDESEIANTIKICDEVFGEDNRLSIVTVVHKSEGRNQERFFGTSHEYALFYAKDKKVANFNQVAISDDVLRTFDKKDEHGLYRLNNYLRSGGGDDNLRKNKPSFFYSIFVSGDLKNISLEKKDGYTEILPITSTGQERTWKTKSDTFAERLDKGLIHAGKDFSNKIQIYEKYYENQVIKTHWIDPKYHAIHHGMKVVESLLGGKYFDFPKSIYLIEDILKLTTDKDSLVLDFFSGSGTTAHSTMMLNAKDNGNRKWIMITLPEKTEEKSEAFKAGYKTIPEISRERIRRAGDKIAAEYPDSKVDYGFRALKIADTNYKEVYKSAGEYQQSTLLEVVDNIKDNRSELDLLYGVLTQSAFELNRPLETRDIAGATVYLYDYFGEISGLVACFASSVPEETIKAIAKLKPLTAVFRDSSFADSQAKVNLAEHFRILSPDTKVKVI